MKCVIAYKYEDKNNKNKYLQFPGDFDSKEIAEKYVNEYVKQGQFVILGKNVQ